MSSPQCRVESHRAAPDIIVGRFTAALLQSGLECINVDDQEVCSHALLHCIQSTIRRPSSHDGRRCRFQAADRREVAGKCQVCPSGTLPCGVLVEPRCTTRCYTCAMPTTKPRYPVTETDEIAAVLDEAQRRWPGVPRSRLVQRVLLDWREGGRAPAQRRESRRQLAGSLPGSARLYDPAADWPE